MSQDAQNWTLIVLLVVAAIVTQKVLVARYTRNLYEKYVHYLDSCRAEAGSRDCYFKVLNEVLVQSSHPKKEDIANLLSSQKHLGYMTVHAMRQFERISDYINNNLLRKLLWQSIKSKLFESLKVIDVSRRFTYYNFLDERTFYEFESALRKDLRLIPYGSHQNKVFDDCGSLRSPKLPKNLVIG